MDKERLLKEFPIKYYKDAITFLHYVMDDFPEDKLQTEFDKGEKPGDLFYHMVATPHFWMKKAERPFEFRAKYESIPDAFNLLNKQLETFTSLLNNNDELHWTPATSIPWIMIRTVNHILHHTPMLIYIRHMLGLPPLKQSDEISWTKLADMMGDFVFKE